MPAWKMLAQSCSYFAECDSFVEIKGNFGWLSRKTVGGLAQQGVSDDTSVPHPGEDRVNNLVLRQQLLTQLPPPLEGVHCAPDRWSGASSTIQSGLNQEINTQEL